MDPVTREEKIISGQGITPVTRKEKLLVEYGGGGGGGGEGTTNYNQLSNKPKINGVTLSGDKSTDDLHIAPLPAGGTRGQVLKKKTDADSDVEWSEAVTVDASLSTTSVNPLQNRAVRGVTGDPTTLTTTDKSNLTAAVNEVDRDLGNPASLTTAEKAVVVNAINELDRDLGNPASLTTAEKAVVVNAINELDGEMGNLSTLTTAAKDKVVNAINELDKDIGDPSSLTTASKNSLVAAVNELDGDVGNRSDLTTTEKGSLVGAINEHDAEIGIVAGLTTKHKRTLVGAINEVDGELGDLVTLSTSSKTTVVAAINEVNRHTVPKGGSQGYLLAKKSGTDGDVEWVEPAEGSTIDTALSTTSENPVQNKEITLNTGLKADLVTSSRTTIVAAINEVKRELGKLNELTTTAKNTVVAAVNEHDAEIGDISTLTTDAKNNIVSAINEHDSEIGNIDDLTTTAKSNLVVSIVELDREIGNLNTLTTSSKNTIVSAVNELDADVGDKSELTTTAKSNLVAAINEHDAEIGDISTITTSAKTTVTAAINELNEKKADLDNVLTLDNETIYTPSLSYHPTTKKYVDDYNDTQDAEIAALVTTGGVKNIVPNEGADTFMQAGITFTKNADGSVTANGTATSTAIYRMKENLTLPKGKYVISGSPSGAADDKFFIQLHKQGVVTHRDTNNPIYPQEWDETGETVYDWYGVAFLNGTVADNITFYPMIRPQGTSADYVTGMNPNPVLATQALADAIAGAGAKNKLKLTGLAQETKNGITCTINTDGTVTVDGTATADSYFFIVTNTKDSAWNFGNNYVMTGCPSGGSADTYGLVYRVGRDSDDQMVRMDWDYGSGVILNGFNATSQRARVMVFVKNGQTVSNLVFSPMVRLAAITDDTYVPYGMDNASLTGVAEVVMDDKNISGRYSGDNYIRAGVTFTLNNDGSVTATGTATTHAYYNCNIGFKLKARRTYRISSGLAANTNGTSMQIIVNGSAAADTLTLGYAIYTPTQDVEATVCVVVRNGNTVNNLKIYPMLMDDRIPDKSYTPPVMSNAEITAELSDTGWQTLKTGIRYRKKNGVVTVVVALDTTDIPTLAGGSWQNLNSDAPIPTTARPTIVYPAVAHARKVTGNENDFFQAQVNTGGAIQILVPNSMTVNSTNYNMLRLEVSFPV